MLTIWIALDDAEASNGGVRYIPGSHGSLLEPTLETSDPSAGHAVMHSCQVIHGAPPNNSDRPRRGYTVHLQEAGLPRKSPDENTLLRGKMPA